MPRSRSHSRSVKSPSTGSTTAPAGTRSDRRCRSGLSAEFSSITVRPYSAAWSSTPSATVVKNGLVTSSTSRPTESLRPARRLRPEESRT